MAPMIDMVFLLLVFFMCVSSLVQADRPMEVDLPESVEGRIPEDRGSRGAISIGKEGELFLSAERQVSLDEMQREVRALLAEDPASSIEVRADRLTEFSEIRRVLDACAEAGAYNIIYSTFQAAD